jgi:hypothetical protein
LGLTTKGTSQRQGGVPFIAVAAYPDASKWWIVPGHSEHYLHSSFVDLVGTGLAGLRPRDDDQLVVNPLIPKDGDGQPSMMFPIMVISFPLSGNATGATTARAQSVDGKVAANAAAVGRLEARLANAAIRAPQRTALQVNLAVNNRGKYYLRLTASYSSPVSSIKNLNDGAYWYLENPASRWTTEDATTSTATLDIDSGIERPVDASKLCFLKDGTGDPVQAPAKLRLECWASRNGWKKAPLAGATLQLVGHKPAQLHLTRPLPTRKFRFSLTAMAGAAVGLTEVAGRASHKADGTKPGSSAA